MFCLSLAFFLRFFKLALAVAIVYLLWEAFSLAFNCVYWKAFKIHGIYTPSDPHEHSYHGTHNRTNAARPVELANFHSCDPLITRVILSNYLIPFWMCFHRTLVAVDCSKIFFYFICDYFGNSLQSKSKLFGRNSICCYSFSPIVKRPSVRVSKKYTLKNDKISILILKSITIIARFIDFSFHTFSYTAYNV